MAARPVRVAADRARALFEAGFGVQELDGDATILMSSDEEDELEDRVFSDQESEEEGEDSQQPDGSGDTATATTAGTR